jgi:hypothetical protein
VAKGLRRRSKLGSEHEWRASQAEEGPSQTRSVVRWTGQRASHALESCSSFPEREWLRANCMICPVLAFDDAL